MITTVYDRDVEPGDSAVVRAPFRVRNELRSAPAHGKPFATPVACRSDNIALGDFEGSFAVVQPVGGTKR